MRETTAPAQLWQGFTMNWPEKVFGAPSVNSTMTRNGAWLLLGTLRSWSHPAYRPSAVAVLTTPVVEPLMWFSRLDLLKPRLPVLIGSMTTVLVANIISATRSLSASKYDTNCSAAAFTWSKSEASELERSTTKDRSTSRRVAWLCAAMPSSAKPAICMNVVGITAREETVITLDWSDASEKAICGGFWTEVTPR